jgi:hypothetical protein
MYLYSYVLLLQVLLARLARAKRSIRRIPRGPGGKIEREDAVVALQRVYRFECVHTLFECQLIQFRGMVARTLCRIERQLQRLERHSYSSIILQCIAFLPFENSTDNNTIPVQMI